MDQYWLATGAKQAALALYRTSESQAFRCVHGEWMHVEKDPNIQNGELLLPSSLERGGKLGRVRMLGDTFVEADAIHAAKLIKQAILVPQLKAGLLITEARIISVERLEIIGAARPTVVVTDSLVQPGNTLGNGASTAFHLANYVISSSTAAADKKFHELVDQYNGPLGSSYPLLVVLNTHASGVNNGWLSAFRDGNSELHKQKQEKARKLVTGPSSELDGTLFAARMRAKREASQ